MAEAQPAFGNQVAATTAYRDCAGCAGGQDSVKTYVFYAALPVNPAKTLTSVTLPNGTSGGMEHIFSIGTSATGHDRPGRHLAERRPAPRQASR